MEKKLKEIGYNENLNIEIVNSTDNEKRNKYTKYGCRYLYYFWTKVAYGTSRYWSTIYKKKKIAKYSTI